MMLVEGKPPLTIRRRIRNAWLRLLREYRINVLTRQVKAQAASDRAQEPVVLFNASTRLDGFSQNAAFSLLTAWGLQLAGTSVLHFACHAGMTRCVLGTNPDDHSELPPCDGCIKQSKRLLGSAKIAWFENQAHPDLDDALISLSLDELGGFEWDFRGRKIELGQLVLPSLRWALRRHHLLDDEPTRFTFREYIRSAYHVATAFDSTLNQVKPKAVVVFNGIMFPEATARWVAVKRGIRVVTHEVGFQPFSAFFTSGQATAYPMEIPESFEISDRQNARLDEYLSQRFKGEFTMAGIRFWPEMRGLDDEFLEVVSQFNQIVPIFTNVVNDTSQVHACSVFSHMYDWLDHVVQVVREHPDTLFVIRAHPDEKRRGTLKHSHQPVSDWVVRNGVDRLPNVIFVDSNEPLSSYELIRASHFVMVYNSSIGLEAALLGVPVLCGGKARYTQYPTVFFPQDRVEYQDVAREFLKSSHIEIPSEFKKNARRVLYWQLFRAALPLDGFISAHPTPGYVQLRKFSWGDLLIENSVTMNVLVDGILNDAPFIMPEGRM
jgi:hypothetical protein